MKSNPEERLFRLLERARSYATRGRAGLGMGTDSGGVSQLRGLILTCEQDTSSRSETRPGPRVELAKARVFTGTLPATPESRKTVTPAKSASRKLNLAAFRIRRHCLRRVLSVDGRPLDTKQQQKENQRMQRLVSHPDEQRKLQQARSKKTEQGARLFNILPDVFVFGYAGRQGTSSR